MRIAVLIGRSDANQILLLSCICKNMLGPVVPECIQVNGNKCKISESACPPCLVRAKHCPGDAVKIINLPEELDTDLTHCYGENGFRLFRLPGAKKTRSGRDSWCKWNGEIDCHQSPIGYIEIQTSETG